MLFAAMLHQEKVIIAQHAFPEDTNEITQVRDLLDPVDLAGAVVTGDAAHAQRETACYIAGPAKDGGRESDYFLFVKGKPAGPAASRLRGHPGRLPTRAGPHRDRLPPRPDHQAIPVGHRCCRHRFPARHRAVRIRRDGYDAVGTLISKEIVQAVTSLGEDRAGPADLAKIARGQWGIESVHWCDTAYREDSSTGYSGSGPQTMATCRNIAISLLCIASVNCDQPHSAGHRTRPDPHAQLPTAMRHRSQTTLPTVTSVANYNMETLYIVCATHQHGT
jgi:predicted transposase YbfD/YdcC